LPAACSCSSGASAGSRHYPQPAQRPASATRPRCTLCAWLFHRRRGALRKYRVNLCLGLEPVHGRVATLETAFLGQIIGGLCNQFLALFRADGRYCSARSCGLFPGHCLCRNCLCRSCLVHCTPAGGGGGFLCPTRGLHSFFHGGFGTTRGGLPGFRAAGLCGSRSVRRFRGLGNDCCGFRGYFPVPCGGCLPGHPHRVIPDPCCCQFNRAGLHAPADAGNIYRVTCQLQPICRTGQHLFSRIERGIHSAGHDGRRRPAVVTLHKQAHSAYSEPDPQPAA
jgi:hypothetical protein